MGVLLLALCIFLVPPQVQAKDLWMLNTRGLALGESARSGGGPSSRWIETETNLRWIRTTKDGPFRMLSMGRREARDRALASLPGVPGTRTQLEGFRLGWLQSIPRGEDRSEVFAIQLTSLAEDSGDLGDALTGLAFWGKSRPLRPHLKGGLGVVALSNPEDGLRAFPGPTLEWTPPSGLQVRWWGPRLEASYPLSKSWSVGATLGIRLFRARLRDGTLFHDRYTPLKISLIRKVHDQPALEIFAQRALSRTWELRDGPLADRELDLESSWGVGFQVHIPLAGF